MADPDMKTRAFNDAFNDNTTAGCREIYEVIEQPVPLRPPWCYSVDEFHGVARQVDEHSVGIVLEIRLVHRAGGAGNRLEDVGAVGQIIQAAA
jgi:hypothetical protein